MAETLLHRIKRLQKEAAVLDARLERLRRRKTAANQLERRRVRNRLIEVRTALRGIEQRREPPHTTHLVRNTSDRIGGPSAISLIVIHVTEGGTLDSVQSQFNDPASRTSSTLGIGANGETRRWIEDRNKPWTQAAFNSRALSIENIGFVSQRSFPEIQVFRNAQWIAWWSRVHGIPITHSTEHGVCKHSDLGAAGGNHNDPGPAWPFNQMLAMATLLR